MPKFYDNWIDPRVEGDALVWHIELTPEQIDSIDPSSIWDYSIEAVNLLLPQLGDRPALCLSGGVDSQVMVECFRRAGASFDIVIMRFPNNLNEHDIKTAVQFCQIRQLPYKFVDIDVTGFLARDLLPFADKYDVSSPQFATHFKFFEALQEQGYTSAICGGNCLINGTNGWSYPSAKEQNDWRSFSERSGFYVMGDFLSYYWKFSILFSCQIEMATVTVPETLNMLSGFGTYNDLVVQRYKTKVAGFIAAGFDIIPQENKFTGFEKVKDYFAEQTGDGWTFEKRFRFPLNIKNPPPRDLRLHLTDKQLDSINGLYDKCLLSRTATSRITD